MGIDVKILIARNDYNAQAKDASLMLATYLSTQGIDYELLDSSLLNFNESVQAITEGRDVDFDLAVALGGDGTILRVAHLVGSARIPILGINFGRLGFLANSSEGGVVEALCAALAGEVVSENRANLCIDVVCEGERDPFDDAQVDDAQEHSIADEADFDAQKNVRGNFSNTQGAHSSHRSLFALNEVAITRGAFGRMIDFELDISGAHIANMRGDGLVVATATGSTAYALSAGGPLVSPGFDGLVVVPIAPHTLHARSIVTAANDVVEIAIPSSVSNRESVVFIDGEPLSFDAPVKRVYVRRGSEPTILLRYQRESFYEHISKTFF